MYDYKHTIVEAMESLARTFKPTTFFDLPAEIRDQIYESTVIDGSALGWVWVNSKHRTHLHAPPTASLTCQQLRKEILPIHYSVSHFAIGICYVIGDAPAFAEWLALIGEDNVKHIRQ